VCVCVSVVCVCVCVCVCGVCVVCVWCVCVCGVCVVCVWCVCVSVCVCVVFYIYLFCMLHYSEQYYMNFSYTVTYVHLIILTFLDTSLSSYLLGLYSLSNDILSVNFLNSFLYLLISVSLLTGQFSNRSSEALSLRVSCPTSSQSNIMWSIVCTPLLQEHVGLSLILYLNRYDCGFSIDKGSHCTCAK
jgi:hypothetical protein